MIKLITIFLSIFCLSTACYGQDYIEVTPSAMFCVKSCVIVLPNQEVITDINVVVDIIKGKPYSSGFISQKVLAVCHDSLTDIPCYSIRRTVDIDPSISVRYPYYVTYSCDNGADLIAFLPSLIRERIFYKGVTCLFNLQ